MFLYLEKNRDSILDWVNRYAKFDQVIEILPIDFDQHWIRLLFLQKKYLFINLINGVMFPSFIALFPLIVGYSVEGGRLDLLATTILTLLVLRLINWWTFRYHPIYVINIYHSVKTRAYEYLIKVDPLFHSTRSSGQIISKINRGSQSLMALVEMMLFSALSLVASSLTVVISLFIISWQAGLLLTVIYAGLIALSGILFRVRTILHYKVRTGSQDKATAINVESMQQAPFIRASFATQEQIEELMKRNKYAMEQEAIGRRWAGYLMDPIQILFALLMLSLALILWNSGAEPGILIGAILSLAGLGRQLFEVGRTIDKVVVNIEDINDLYEFIRDFGKQTYPVLISDEKTM